MNNLFKTSPSVMYLINREVINNIKTLSDLRVTTSALVSKKIWKSVKQTYF